MSRIGKAPISLPDGVSIEVKDTTVNVKGPKGELHQEIDAALSCKVEDGVQGSIKIALKYHPVTKMPAIKKLERASRPGLRYYRGAKELPRVLNGLGVSIVSTSKGVMTDKEARANNVGGEVLCYVY